MHNIVIKSSEVACQRFIFCYHNSSLCSCTIQKGSEVSSDSEIVQQSLRSTTVQPQVDMQDRSQQLHDSERLPLQQQSLAGSADTSTIQHQPTSSATGKQIKSGK